MTAALPAAEAVRYGHVEPVPVYFDDLDVLGVVHNARYAVLLERALTTYWSGRGFGYAGAASPPDVFHAVREFTITYHAPIRDTGAVAVHFWVAHLGRTSLRYGFRFLSADRETLHAEGHRLIVRLEPATLRPAPWTDAIRAGAAPLAGPQIKAPTPLS